MISLSSLRFIGAAAGLTLAICIPSTPAQALTLDIVGCAAPVVTASGGTISISGCGTVVSPPGSPTCTVSATPNPVPAAGGTVTLGVTNCSPTGTTAPGPWSTSLTGATISGNTLTVPANTGSQRAVVATIQACTSDATPVCATLTAQTAQSGVSPPPPTGSLPRTCGSLSVIPFAGDYSSDMSYLTRYDISGMSSTTVAMGRFTTGDASNLTAQFGLADVTGTNSSYRKIYVSTSACGFSGAFTAGPTKYPVFRYTVGANPAQTGYKNLLPNTTYYVMATTESSTGPTCTGGGCGFSLVLQAP